MKRLIYSPSINVWVKSDTGVFDLSPYVTDCTIDRRINSVSYANVTFRNPKVPDSDFKTQSKFLFTEHKTINDNTVKYGPMFHPMDPIIITMTRLRGRPIQVFTGFCDTTPYVQLYPGTAKLTASCTLKRLQYTYWDPALPFVKEFMEKNGWAITKSGTAFNSAPQNTGNLNDSSIGYLLYKLLEEVGGWDPNDIYIQELPGTKISQLVAKLYKDIEKEEANSIKDFHDFLHKIVGAAAYGNIGTSGDGSAGGGQGAISSGPVKNEKEKVQTIRSTAVTYGIPPEFPLAVAIVETDLQDNADGTYTGWYQWLSSESYVGKPPIDMSKAHDLGYATSKFCQAAKYRENYKQYGYATWARACQLNPSSVNNAGTTGQYGAFNANPDDNPRYSDAQFPGFVNQAKDLLNKHK